MADPATIALAAGGTVGAAVLAIRAARSKSEAQREQRLLAENKAPYVVDKGTFVRGLQMDRRTQAGEVTPHWGIDISGTPGTPVHAVKGGTVIHVGPRSGYGNTVTVRHHDGQQSSLYAHLHKPTVPQGAEVRGGDVVGLMGHTTAGPDGVTPTWGLTMGTHLHMEIHPVPTPVLTRTFRRLDPVAWLRREGIPQYRERYRPEVTVST